MNTPPGWGEDPLSKFLVDAHHNCMASFANYARLPVMAALKEVDACFRDVVGFSFNLPKELFLPILIGRCHAAYLSSIQLSLAGQVPEAYPSIRLCVENALYAVFIQDDSIIDADIPERWRIWLERDESEMAEKTCRATFTHAKVRDHLVTRDGGLGERAEMLYQRTIKYGAHPNFYAQAQASELPSEKGGGSVQYLLPNTDASKLCIQTSVEAGTCALRIFGLILEERYEEAGIHARIPKIEYTK